jgi:hypothetical protein
MTRTPDQVADMHKQLLRDNCGFRKAEYLPGNIGYLEIRLLWRRRRLRSHARRSHELSGQRRRHHLRPARETAEEIPRWLRWFAATFSTSPRT